MHYRNQLVANGGHLTGLTKQENELPQWDEEYRGYLISYQRNDRFAWIYRPGDLGALNEIPQADRSNSRHVLREEAHRIIDADIENHRAS